MQKGFTIWFTGVSKSGKTTLSNLLHHRLQALGVTNVEVLDGEEVKMHLSKGLGYTREDVATENERIGWVAQLLTRNNVPNLVCAISPYREVRDGVRKLIEHAGGKGSFVEVFVDCPVEVCEARDKQGMYEKARKGQVKHFPGVDEPYEPPHIPEVKMRTDQKTPEECVEMIVEHLVSKGLIGQSR
ncbi:MAG: adenylyl-sulfate kinase [Thermodesulfobacteriota bacterium]